MNILLPIETINREIDYKLIIAAFFAGKGHKIFIGQHDFLMSLLHKFIGGGLYIGKNLFRFHSNKEKGELYYKLKKSGFDIIYLHEEGAVFKGNEDNWKKTINNLYDTNYFDQNDRHCVWGNFQLQHDLNRTYKKIKMSSTGHPRFDLYKKEWINYFDNEVNLIKKKYNDFVLINGNYTSFNHGLGIDHLFSAEGDYNVNNLNSRLEFVSTYTYFAKQCISLIELIHQLAVKFPSMNFIFRPHPSENQHYYKTLFNGVSNIYVKHDGPVSPWIIAAIAIIHDGCSTAIESYLAGKPIINFKPFFNEKYDIWLPNQLGKHAKNLSQVIDILKNLDNYSFNIKELKCYPLICDLLYNFENDSFDFIIKIISEKINESCKIIYKSPKSIYIRFLYYKIFFRNYLYYHLKKNKKNHIKYHYNKFYGFNINYIIDKITFMEEKLNKKIKINFHNPQIIEFE